MAGRILQGSLGPQGDREDTSGVTRTLGYSEDTSGVTRTLGYSEDTSRVIRTLGAVGIEYKIHP